MDALDRLLDLKGQTVDDVKIKRWGGDTFEVQIRIGGATLTVLSQYSHARCSLVDDGGPVIAIKAIHEQAGQTGLVEIPPL